MGQRALQGHLHVTGALQLLGQGFENRMHLQRQLQVQLLDALLLGLCPRALLALAAHERAVVAHWDATAQRRAQCLDEQLCSR